MRRSYPLTFSQTAFLITLTGLGLLGNIFSINLFSGVNFLFGGIAVMLVLWYFGFWYGIAAAIIAYSYTFYLWGHAFGWIAFVLEILILGLSLRKFGYRGLFLTDLLFWLVIGMPLVWFSDRFVLHIDNQYTLFIALKQAYNGLFNVLVVNIVILADFIPRRLTKLKRRVRFSTFNFITSISVGTVFIAILTYTIINSHALKRDINQEIRQTFLTQTRDLQERLITWYDTHSYAAWQLAEQSKKYWEHPELIQEYTRTIHELFPHFHNMYVADSTAETLAFSPVLNEHGQSTIGLKFNDRNYYQKVKHSNSIILSDVFKGRGGIFQPIAIVAVPILKDSTFLGFVSGALNLSYLHSIISDLAQDHGIHILILDHEDKVVVASDSEYYQLEHFRFSDSKHVELSNAGFWVARPKQKNLSITSQWNDSQYFFEAFINEDIPWKIVLHLPVNVYQRQIYQGYIHNFSLGLGFFVLLMFTTILTTKWVTDPLEKLTKIAHSLPRDIGSNGLREITWPAPRSTEQESLIRQMKFAASQLNRNFTKIQKQTTDLRNEILKRTTAQDKLQESEARFRNVVETIGEGLLITDFDDRIIYANSMICKMTQYRRDELEGTIGYELLLPEEQWEMLRERHQRRRKEQSEVYETPVLRKNNTSFECRVHAVPFYNSKGELVGTLGVLSDISELKETQHRLLRKNTALNVLTTSNEVLVRSEDLSEIYEKICWTIAEYGNYEIAWIGEIKSSGGQRTLTPVAQWGDTEDWILNHPLTVDGVNSIQDHPAIQSIQDRRPVLLEHISSDITNENFASEILRFNIGSYLVLPLVLDQKIFGVLAIYSSEPGDLSETEKIVYSTLAEDLSYGIQAIRRNDERLLALDQLELQDKALNATSNAILITDRDGIILWTNPAFTNITGYTQAEALGQRPTMLHSERHEVSFHNKMWDTICAGNSWQGEIINKRKDGTLYTEWQSVTPVRNDDGEITHFIAIKQDVSDYKGLEQQLIQSQKIESMGEIAGGIAHDFNNVLTVIEGAREILQYTLKDSLEGSKYLPMIQSSVERGRDITSRMLTFTRADDPHFETISMMKVFSDVRNIVEHTLSKQVELKITEYHGTDLVQGDQSQLQQVLLNLSINAADAMPEGGIITFIMTRLANTEFDRSNKAETDFLKIQVIDTGHGIPPKIQETIFEPFFTTKPQGKGTGLGLAIVRRIVQNHGGRIECSSTPGNGTTFTIYLPLIENDIKLSSDDSLDKISGANGEQILIVDDEEHIRDVLGEILSQKGYSILTATNGKQALDKVTAKTQLVVTDIGLPDYGGNVLAERLLAKFPHLNILAITGYVDDSELAQLKEVGVIDIIQKPFNIEFLLKEISSVLANHNVAD